MQYRYRTFWKRLGAAFIDGLIFSGISVVLEKTPEISNSPYFSPGVLTSILATIYTVYCHKALGKTIGKMVTEIEVIHVSETKRLTFSQAFLRDGLGCVFQLIGIMYFTIKGGTIEDNLADYIVVAGFAFAWTALEFITMLMSKKGRALHDYLGSSVVVRSDLREVTAEQA